jgi:hypothetical protein
MKILSTLAFMFSISLATAQIDLDLAIPKGNTQTVILSSKTIRLQNCSLKYNYKVDWDFVQNMTPPFQMPGEGVQSAVKCSDEVGTIKEDLINAESEEMVSESVEKGIKLLATLKDPKCVAVLKNIIDGTQHSFSIPYAPLKNNQVITVIITKVDKENGNPVKDGKWTFVLKTPEKTRWLVHYGLTYTPSIISKTDHYYSMADTSVANKFTVTKENNNGPKPWENISATINFTYPFHADSRGFDGGFTAGFGLSAGLELSGQAGLSMIIGENVILGSGMVMMQKYKLMGKYKEGQIIKENLDFNSLHDKVWLPELYFTLGFRFGNNPFAKKAAEPAATPAATPVTPTQP